MAYQRCHSLQPIATGEAIFRPISTHLRLDILDVIRGLAVLGILFANIMSWSGYRFMPYEQIATLPHYEWDKILYDAFAFFVDTKFYAIFSILFGVGFYLQFQRQQDRESVFLPIYRRRLTILLLIGMLHAVIWSGDILTLYALVGFVAIRFRHLAPRTLLLTALGMFASIAVINIILLNMIPGYLTVPPLAHVVFPDMPPQAVVKTFLTGTLGEVFLLNLHNLWWRWVGFIPSGRPFLVLGLLLLGFYLCSRDFFRKEAHHGKLLLIFGTAGILFTGSAKFWGGKMDHFPATWMDIGYKILMVAGQVPLALAYVCLVTWLFRTSMGVKLLHPLSFVGRMAFTNYLVQSVIGIFLFYTIGLGLVATLGLAQLYVVTVAICVSQVAGSWLWLRIYRFGPVEWLWRCLTYRQRFPLRN